MHCWCLMSLVLVLAFGVVVGVVVVDDYVVTCCCLLLYIYMRGVV